MKKDCAYTRKSLRKYLRGHLFKYEQVRIARHLNTCPVCRSEFQALKKVSDTRQLLKDITPPENLGQRIRAGVSGLGRLRLLLYRPLWLAAIIGVGVLLYVNFIAPRRDIEIENLEKSLPPAAPIASAPTVTTAAVVPFSDGLAAKPGPAAQEAKPAVAPFLITLTPANDKEAVQSVNEVLRGHAQFVNLKFSDTVREISGSLTPQEMTVFFSRIQRSAKVSYNRKRLASFSSAEPIPFVMKMNPAPRISDPSSSPGPGEHKPDHAPAAAPLPVSAPTASVP